MEEGANIQTLAARLYPDSGRESFLSLTHGYLLVFHFHAPLRPPDIQPPFSSALS